MSGGDDTAWQKPVRMGKGYQGTVVLALRWSATTVRDPTNATGTITVYSTPPVQGVARYWSSTWSQPIRYVQTPTRPRCP
jgi:hypothetical protein